MADVNKITLDGTEIDIVDTVARSTIEADKTELTQSIANETAAREAADTAINGEIENIKTAVDGKPTAAISYNTTNESLDITTGTIAIPAGADMPMPLAEGGAVKSVTLNGTTHTLSSGGNVTVFTSEQFTVDLYNNSAVSPAPTYTKVFEWNTLTGFDYKMYRTGTAVAVVKILTVRGSSSQMGNVNSHVYLSQSPTPGSMMPPPLVVTFSLIDKNASDTMHVGFDYVLELIAV